jgi:EmrB/QacA subfamily drug resistance transporter
MNDYLWIVISVAFSSFMARMNNYSVNVSLPTISQFFAIGMGEASRIITGYLLIITSTLLLFGKLSDRLGLKKVFLLGYVIFVFGSLLCGISQSILMLIGFRFVQGIGAAMLLATSFAIISKFLPPDRTGWAFGITSTASALGVATGAPVGGLITGYLSWHWVFLINVPVGLLAIFVALKKIPSETRTEAPAKNSRGFDVLGAALSFWGLVLLLYGINKAREWGWHSPATISCLGGAFFLLGAFVFHEKRCREPLLHLQFFRNRGFTFALIATFLAFMLIAGNAFLLPFYLQIIKGLDPKQTGLVLLTYSLIYVFLSPYAGRLSDRINPASLCMIAMFSASVNSFFFAWTLPSQGFLSVFVFLIWLALSYVLFFSPKNNQIMRHTTLENKGSASGLFNTTTNLAMVFGVALFEAIFSHTIPHLEMKGASLKQANIPLAALLQGFSNAYLIGGLLCAAALFSSFLTGQAVKAKKKVAPAYAKK